MRIAPLARRIGSTALVVALGAGLSACGGDTSPADSSSPSESSSPSGTTSESGSDDAMETATAALTERSADDFYPAVMKAMREAETFAFTSTSGEGAQVMSGQARFGADGMEMKASSTGAQAVEMIMIDQVMYMKSPDMPSGDKYLKIDLSDPNSLFGMIGKATDPEVMLKSMEAPKKLELLGEEEVDGVATNHYRITLATANYLKALEIPEAMAGMMPEEMVTEMWVDGDDLPRKFAQTVETSPPGGGEPVSATTEGTYSDFGMDVDIVAPPANQISTQKMPGV